MRDSRRSRSRPRPGPPFGSVEIPIAVVVFKWGDTTSLYYPRRSQLAAALVSTVTTPNNRIASGIDHDPKAVHQPPGRLPHGIGSVRCDIVRTVTPTGTTGDIAIPILVLLSLRRHPIAVSIQTITALHRAWIDAGVAVITVHAVGESIPIRIRSKGESGQQVQHQGSKARRRRQNKPTIPRAQSPAKLPPWVLQSQPPLSTSGSPVSSKPESRPVSSSRGSSSPSQS